MAAAAFAAAPASGAAGSGAAQEVVAQADVRTTQEAVAPAGQAGGKTAPATASVKRRHAAPRVSANTPPPDAFFTITQCRVFDTRLPANAPALQAGAARTIQITGNCGIPTSAKLVAVNATVTQQTAAGSIELYPGDGTPTGLQLNDFLASGARDNNAVVPLALNGNGTVDVLLTATGSQSADFVLDLSGYFAVVNPIAVDDSYSTPLNTALAQAAPGVLANDTLNGGAIFSYGASTGGEQTTIGAATPTSAAGSITLHANGSFNYTPATGFQGNDTFKYVLKNTFGSSTATVTIAVGKTPQTITFTSTAPAGATVGGPTYNVTATASSGLTVAFTIDASAASVCSISGSTVSFIGAGTCVIDANQAGNATYAPAPQVQQSFAVGKGSQTITFTSTAPAGATVGGPTYNVTATASSGLTVAFTIDASASSVCSISGSTVSFTGVGTCVIDANQAGNANYNAAPQVQQSFAVGMGNQTITFTSTAPSNAQVGGPTYNVTATASSGLTVTFTIDASATSVCSISGSTVSFTATGTCVIDANQAGNANYNAAPQAQQSFGVGKNDQTITFTSTAPAGAKVGGPTYTVTATASSGLTVAFTIDASAASVCSISGSTVSFTGVGTCVIDANQAGNANYNPAPQVQQSFAVAKGDQTITFTSTAPAGATVGGPTYNVTATASSGLAVTFTIDASASGVCTISGGAGPRSRNGVVSSRTLQGSRGPRGPVVNDSSATVSFIGVGTCVIDANQAGDSNWNPAPQAQQSFAVAKGDQTITFTSTAPSGATVGGPTYNVTATASSGLTVTFTIDASAASVCSISGSTVSFTANGTCVIDANQAGNANYNAAPQAQQSFAVGKGNQTITFTSTAPAGAKVGGPTYTVTATASSGLTVAFTIDASASAVCSISGSTVSFTGVGTCVIDANQAGNANYNAAPQVQQSFAVAKGDQTITFTSTAPAGAKVGGPTYTVTATASSGLTVAFTIDASASAVCSISGSTVSFIGPGTCVIDANQAGNANYNAAPQAQQSFAVAKGDQTITFTSTAPAGAKFGGPTYTVTATASSGLTVTFTIDASASSVCSISGSTVSFIGAGTCVIDANQAGNANYNAAPQAQQSFPVAKADQTITFTSTAPTMATPGGPTYTVSATATSGLAVTFTIDATASSVCSISGSTVSFTADGTCVIDANQAGNANYNAAPQVQQSFVVDTPPTVTSTNPANGATSVPVASTITINFSKSVTVTGSPFSLSCSPGSAPTFTVTPASPAASYVLHPSTNLPFDSNCTVTVVAADVTDAAGRNMVSNYMFSFGVPPIAVADTYPETLIGNVSINSSVIAFSVTANDQHNSPITITAFDATSANGGTVAMTTSGAGIGQFTYNPAAGYTGADSFTYTISDANGSSTATVHLTLSGIIWFINDNAGAGDGRLSSPFNSLAAFQAVNDGAAHHPAANANIFLYDSSTGYTGPVVLLNGQKLIGQDATSSLSAITGLTPGTSSATLPSTGGGSPNKVSITATGNDVTLGSGNTVWGMTLGNATAGIALSGSSVGSLKLRDLTINTTGAAVSLASGALDAILNAVSSGGGTHGISLTTTTGSFDVEGGGASDPANTTKGRTTAKNGGGTLTLGSGGTIQNATSAGVLLSTATNVTLRNMTIENNGGSGINTGGDGITATNGSALTLDNDLIQGQTGNNGVHATGVAGVAFQHTEATNNGSASGTAGTHVWDVRIDNGTGTSSAANSLFHNSLENIFGVSQTGSATMTLNVTNSQFSDTATTASGNVGLLINLQNTSNVTLSADSSTFLRNRTVGVEYLGNDSSSGSFTVTNSTCDQNATGIGMAHQGLGQTASFNITGNTLNQTGGLSTAIAVNLGTTSNATTLMQGKIQNNTIGTNSVVHSGSSQGSGIGVTAGGAGTLTTTVSGNSVFQVDNEGLNAVAAQGTGTLNLTVTNNHFSLDNASPNSDFGAMVVDGGTPSDSQTLCLNMSGNTDTGNASSGGTGVALLTEAGTPTFNIQGYGGSANNASAIASFIDGANTDSPTPALISPGAGTMKAAPAPCPTPP
ncbi:MAG TPA: Ig-like domain-containing protein [Thermoanaerobaculia bacterium]|nr:Ig-like domain-containing protein [Thermoanaerobaculia bacterium]